MIQGFRSCGLHAAPPPWGLILHAVILVSRFKIMRLACCPTPGPQVADYPKPREGWDDAGLEREFADMQVGGWPDKPWKLFVHLFNICVTVLLYICIL